MLPLLFVLFVFIVVLAMVLVVMGVHKHMTKQRRKKRQEQRAPQQPHVEVMFPVVVANQEEETNHKARNKKPLLVYLHVCMIGIWHKVVKNLLTKIYDSSLMDNVDKVRVVALGPSKDELAKLQELIEPYHKCEIRLQVDDMSNYERTTLNLMWDDAASSSGDYNILYLHSKGVTKTETEMQDRMEDWVDFMCHYLIFHYEKATYLLDHGADVCGCNYTTLPKPHFSGNFWWSTASYLKTLPREIDPKDYLAPEMWLFTKNPTAVQMSQSHCPHYFKRYRPKEYSPPVLKSNKKNVIIPFTVKEEEEVLA